MNLENIYVSLHEKECQKSEMMETPPPPTTVVNVKNDGDTGREKQAVNYFLSKLFLHLLY